MILNQEVCYPFIVLYIHLLDLPGHTFQVLLICLLHTTCNFVHSSVSVSLDSGQSRTREHQHKFCHRDLIYDLPCLLISYAQSPDYY